MPRVYRVFEDERSARAYMLMDYIEGPNLERLRLQQPEKRLTVEKALDILAPIFAVVGYLHKQDPPIIHRDVKPANIIVPTTNDEAVLVDLGIAKNIYRCYHNGYTSLLARLWCTGTIRHGDQSTY